MSVIEAKGHKYKCHSVSGCGLSPVNHGSVAGVYMDGDPIAGSGIPRPTDSVQSLIGQDTEPVSQSGKE